MLQKAPSAIEPAYHFDRINVYDNTDDFLYISDRKIEDNQDRACKSMLLAILHRSILDYLFHNRTRKEFRQAFKFLFIDDTEESTDEALFISFGFICEIVGFDKEEFRNRLKLKFYELEADPNMRMRYVKGKI